MYTEFKIIYVCMGVLAILLLACIALLVLILRKLNNGNANQRTFNPAPKNAGASYGSGMGVVFCANCGTQYDGTTKVCPKCGSTR